MHRKLCPSLVPRKVVSNQFWCASLWPSPLFPGKLRPSESVENAGPGRGSCTGQSWPKTTFLLSPGVPLATTSCQPELQAVQFFCSGQSSPDVVWKDRRATVTRQGTGSRLAAFFRSAPPRPLEGSGFWPTGTQA